MKLNFSRSVGRFRAKSLPLLTGLLLSPLAVMGQPMPIYINTGIINNNNLPQVDAITFVNSGTWYIYTTDKYHTADTLNYTNKNSMLGEVGWDFALYPSTAGHRSMSANFFNASGATIQAMDGAIANPSGYRNCYSCYPVSYLWVSATNIVNKGTLTAAANGELELIGRNIDLSHSKLNITPLPDLYGGSYNRGTNFTPDTAVYSMYWAQTNMPATLPAENGGQLILPIMNSLALWDGTTVSTPFTLTTNLQGVVYINSNYGVQDPTSQNLCSTDYFRGPVLTFVPTVADSMSTILGSNEWKQAVFVRCNPSITAQIRFTPGSNPSDYLQTAVVQLMGVSQNALSLSLETNAIYWVDTLGSETNRGLNIDTNYDPFYSCTGPVSRPANYNVSRTDPGAFAAGVPGSGTPPANFFYDASFVNSGVSNMYSAYSVFIDNLPSEPGGLVGTTNLPGRIHICANNLNLNVSRIGAQGDIWIQASNLVGSTSTVIDCQNLSFDLGSTNGYLNITNLAQPNANRFRGTIDAWSALWTNYQVVTVNITNVITNTIAFSVLVLDASQLSNNVSVMVQDLILNSTNIVVSDSVTVTNSLLFNGQTLTLLGDLTLAGLVQSWNSTIAPIVHYFTNYGTLTIANDAHFGDDTAVPYTEFVNYGAISSAGQTIDSLDIQIIGGSDDAFAGDFSATAQSIEMTDAYIHAAGDINLSANTLLIDPSTLYAGGALNFNVTTNLSDNGALNSFTCNNGFNLPIKPQTGDLLYTTIDDIAHGDEVDHAWAGTDRLATPNGYTNNAAIGILILDAQGADSSFVFNGTSGPGVTNALYVDELELLDYASYTNHDTGGNIPVLTFNNLVIYYAKAIIAGGVDVTAKLDHKNNDCLRYVSAYPGHFSSTNLVYPDGTIVTVNAALAQSTSIDSNGNGIKNADDPTPFFVSSQVDFTETLTNKPSPMVLLTWHSIPSATNFVYYSTNSVGPYVVLTNFVSPSLVPPAGGWPITNTMYVPVTGSSRYYRVWVYPNSTSLYGY